MDMALAIAERAVKAAHTRGREHPVLWSGRPSGCLRCAREGGRLSVEDPNHDEQLTQTATGLGYVDIVEGTGQQPKTGDSVSVHYTGWLKSGQKFDSSHDRGQPLVFAIGRGQVIKGWDEGVGSMRVGGKRKLVIPAHLAYGDRGAGRVIPPGATLIFEVELVGINAS